MRASDSILRLVVHLISLRRARNLWDQWLQEGTPSPFSTIRRLAHYVAMLHIHQESAPKAQWIEAHKVLQLSGHNIHTDDFAKMYSQIKDAANAILHNLTNGIDASVPIDLNGIADDMSC